MRRSDGAQLQETTVNPLRTGRRWVVLAIAGISLLTLSWVYSTAPWNAPDEAAHYLRALNLSNGWLLGPKTTTKGSTPAQTAWEDETVRDANATVAIAPPGTRCESGIPIALVGGCWVQTGVGAYPPLAYVLPALALRVSSHALPALYLARIASAVVCVAFLALALWLLWEGSAWSVLGLLAAFTPEVFFMSAILNSNGFVIASNIAFLSALIRISRSPVSASRWVWSSAAVCGACTILGWQAGWVFVAADIAAVTLVLAWGQLREIVVRRRRELTVTGAVLFSAVAVYYAYAAYAGMLGTPFHVTSLQPGLDALPQQLTGSVLLSGDLLVGLPGLNYYYLYFGPVLLIILAALVLTNNRRRFTLVLVLLAAFAFPVVFFSWIYRFSGFGLQPRHVMPVLTLIPVISGEVLFRVHHRIPRRLGMAALTLLIGMFTGLQIWAWYLNASLTAGAPRGTSAAPFSGLPWIWQPPVGWTFWAIPAVCGALAILVASSASTIRIARTQTDREPVPA